MDIVMKVRALKMRNVSKTLDCGSRPTQLIGEWPNLSLKFFAKFKVGM
jgi:hypothetical protein